MLSKLLIASMLASASADCAGWCNSWTCGFSSCDTCEVCTTATFNAGNCYSWCNPYTCSSFFSNSCGGCSGRGATINDADGLNCMAVNNGDYCAGWCNSYTTSFTMCGGCSSGMAGEPWTPVDGAIVQWNSDIDTVPNECQPGNTNWAAKYPFPRGPPVAYMPVPMTCCTAPGAKTGADLYIGGSSGSPLYVDLGTSDFATAYRANGNNPCFKTNDPDSFGNFAALAGCQAGKAWYGEGCKSSDATQRCDCTAQMVSLPDQQPQCLRSGDYPGPIHWFVLHTGCLSA